MTTIQHNGTTRKLTPLLMKDFLVAQTLKGLKTQTRRLNGLEEINKNPNRWKFDFKDTTRYFFSAIDNQFPIGFDCKCPYGQVGDIIWVRETWCKNESKQGRFHYAASVCSPKLDKPDSGWKPSIHMPKEACRLFLEITDIRPERLHDITKEDAIAEGINPTGEGYEGFDVEIDVNYSGEQDSFFSLWDSINGRNSNLDNPWVWRIAFKVVPKPTNWPA